jgi:hypothetical protein
MPSHSIVRVQGWSEEEGQTPTVGVSGSGVHNVAELPLGARAAIRFAREQLERDDTTQTQMPRAVHAPHSAAPDQFEHFVAGVMGRLASLDNRPAGVPAERTVGLRFGEVSVGSKVHRAERVGFGIDCNRKRVTAR